MGNDWKLDIGVLVLRLGIGYVFLYAAFKNTENAEARKAMTDETAVLFRDRPKEERDWLALICFRAGMVMMYGGGVSVLLGLEPRVGGLILAVFSLLGMRVHAIRRDEAKEAGEAGNPMGWSAFMAHTAAGLKNWALAAAGVTFILTGAGRYGLTDYTGALLGWN